MKLAFIGLGIMGSRMAKRLATNGYDITVYNRTQSKAEELQEYGVQVTDSPKACVSGRDVVFTMLSTPEVVEDVAFGKNGFVGHMKKNALWIDCSTVDPASSVRFAEKSSNYGIRFMDAPVAGTKQPAEKGELLFLVGGKDEDLDEVTALLELMGKKIVYGGDIGSGASLKIIVNLMLAQSMTAFSEAAGLGVALGLDRQQVHDVLLNAPVSAPFLKVVREKLENGDTSANFPLKWMHKDLNLATKMAYENNIPLPSANLTKELFAKAKSKGHGDDDFSTIYHVLSGE